MAEQDLPKNSRMRLATSRLSAEERLAFKTVSNLLEKPLSEFLIEDDTVNVESESSEDNSLRDANNGPLSNHNNRLHTQIQPRNGSQHHSYDSQSNDTELPHNQIWAQLAPTNQESSPQNERFDYNSHDIMLPSGLEDSNPRNSTNFQDNTIDDTINRSAMRSSSVSNEGPWIGVSAAWLASECFVGENTSNSAAGSHMVDMPSFHQATAVNPMELSLVKVGDDWHPYLQQYNSFPESSSGEQELENLQSYKTGPGEHQPVSLANENWPIDSPPLAINTSAVNALSLKDHEWITVDVPTMASPQRPQQRRSFQSQQAREETSNTRKLKACVNENDPSGICQTCQSVTKPVIHTLPCMRYKLTDCTLFRIGKAPGLEFTFRWPVMKLKDITNWSDAKIRKIKVLSDVCPEPLELDVRRFHPHPEDSMQKAWMDGHVKKYKTTTPFAIVNMTAARDVMRDYINDHIFKCMEYWLEGRDELVRETFKYARIYMKTAPSDEQSLLADYFRLWFASRRTATTETIIGDDTLDMEPETTDRSYPLFGKVPLPPVMIQQLDMILTLGFLIPLRKKVLEQFNRIVLKNNPKSWLTMYLITFMSSQSCAAFTKENYANARKHGLVRRFAMPSFITERHHTANVMLAHYHYCTKPCNPFKINWNKRHTTPFADMTTDDVDFLLRTSEMVEARKDKFRRVLAAEVYENDLYFISQMYEEDWRPRDSEIETGDETVSGVPLKRFGSPQHK